MSGTSVESPAPVGDTLGPVLHPIVFPLAVLAVGQLLEWLVPVTDMSRGVTVPLGVVLVLAGGTLMGASARLFFRAGTSPNPTRPTTALVTGGPFRLSRNPMYVGISLVYLGVALLLDSVWAVLLTVVVVVSLDRLVIRREERFLEARFGEDYLAFKRRVRRWF